MKKIKARLLGRLSHPDHKMNVRETGSEVLTLTSEYWCNNKQELYSLCVELTISKVEVDGIVEIEYFTIERIHVYKNQGQDVAIAITKKEIEDHIDNYY